MGCASRSNEILFHIFAAHSELRKVLFRCCLWRFVFVCEIYREPMNGFAPNSQGRRAWSFPRTSLKVMLKCQLSRSPGTKKWHFSALSAAYVRFVFSKTSSASSYNNFYWQNYMQVVNFKTIWWWQSQLKLLQLETACNSTGHHDTFSLTERDAFQGDPCLNKVRAFTAIAAVRLRSRRTNWTERNGTELNLSRTSLFNYIPNAVMLLLFLCVFLCVFVHILSILDSL